MEIELSQKTIDAIALRAAQIVTAKLKESLKKQRPPEMCSCKEAAEILGGSPGHMRRIADRFPHVKSGECKQGKLLFVREKLLEMY